MRLGRLGALALAVALVAGCADQPAPPQRFADLRFTGSAPIRLDVSSIEVVDAFQPSFRPPEVEQDFPVPPERAIHDWVRDRLDAADPASANRARVTIRDAAVRETDLMPGEGIGAAFTDEQTRRFDGHLAVTIEILDAHGLAVRTAAADTSRSRSLAEDATLDDRDRAWYDMTRAMVEDLGAVAEREIRAGFYPYIL